jgi:4-diphosphocytidyl-2-C-methyl-D-erythritol kinase
MLSVNALAKINLHLRVLERRNDGFHEVRTLLQTIDLADTVRAEMAPADVLELRVDPSGCVTDAADNLVLRAAEALRRRTGVRAGARLDLSKKIPIGAGLGGGSSDAAASLVLLDELWDLHLEPTALAGLAAGLGSDVPFFLAGGLAMATGRGEKIRPLRDLADYGVVVCTPPIEVSTTDVFGRFSTRARLTSQTTDATVDVFVAGSRDSTIVEPPWQDMENDLEPIVIERWPEVGRAVVALKATGPLYAAVTGSGASSFALFQDLAAARVAAAGLESSWDVHVGTTIGREFGRPKVKRIDS